MRMRAYPGLPAKAGVLPALLLAAACGAGPESLGSAEYGIEGDPRVGALAWGNFYGQRVRAPRVDPEQALYQGDILIPIEHPAAPGTVSSALSGAVRVAHWPSEVPYRFDASFAGDAFIPQREAIVRAMDEWADAVPGLKFRPAQLSGDQCAETCLTLVRNPDPNAAACVTNGLGMSPTRKITIPDWCATSYSMQHELAHALGVIHEQSRKDRDRFVRVNWAHVIGCPNTAAQASDCLGTHVPQPNGQPDIVVNDAPQFEMNALTHNLFDYDVESIMQYERNAFSSDGQPTLTRLDDPSAPLGQRTHLSAGDVRGMRALYPQLVPATVAFQGSAPALCTLQGRDDDVATVFDFANMTQEDGERAADPSWLPQADLDAQRSAGGFASLERFPAGTFAFDCTAASPFWAEGYDYPASGAATVAGLPSDPDLAEHFAARGELQILSAGLVPVLFAID